MEETKITLTEYLDGLKSTTFEESLSRKYVPLEEKQEIINLALTMIFGKFEDGELIEEDVYQEPDTLVDDMFINTSIIRAYTNIEEKNRVLIYNAFMQEGLYEKLLDAIPDARDFDRIFSYRISEKREYIKENYMNTQSSTLTSLVTELVKKEIAVQDLQKKVLEQTKKINSQYTKEEMLAMTNTFAEVNKLSSNPEYLKAVAEAVHNDKTIKPFKKPQDHKKSQKKTGE